MKDERDSNDESELLEIVDAVADGQKVDWDTAESSAPESQRPLIHKLKVISQVAWARKEGQPVDLAPDNGSVIRTTDTPARSWGHLQIVEKIGAGAFGEVFRANDPYLDREVALKLFHPDRVQPTGRTVKAIEEGRLLARVRHPNVATVHGAEQYAGRVGMWMELIEGSTLQEILQDRGTLSPEEAMKFAREVCRALTALHDAGVIHRDIKASNIMRAEDGRIVLMDLGVSRDIGHLDSVKLYGTPLFAAPEVLLEKTSTQQSDLYSVGVLLFLAVTGRCPITGKTLEEVRENHRAGKTERIRNLRPDLPEAFIHIVDRALAPDPDDRFATASEFIQTLDDALGETSTSIAKSSRWHPKSKTAIPTSRSVRITLPIIAALLVGAVLIYTHASRVEDVTGDKPRVLVMNFANLTGDESLDPIGDIAADWINQGISHAGFAYAVPTLVARPVIRSARVRITDHPDESHYRSIAEASGATIIVSGLYDLDSDTLRFRVNLTDTHNGVRKYEIAPVYGPLSRRMETINRLRSYVMSALAVHLDPAFESDLSTLPDTMLQLPLYDAVREYLAGVDQLGVDNDLSLYHFNRAVELDSTLVFSRLWIAGIYKIRGQFAQADSIYRLLHHRRDRSTPFEQHVLDEAQSSLVCDWEGAVTAIRQAERYAPRDFTINYLVAVDELLVNNPQSAVDALNRVEPSDYYKDHVIVRYRYWILVEAHHLLGDYQKELEAARRGFELYPAWMWIRNFEVRALAAMGTVQGINAVIDDCLNLPYESGNPAEVMCAAAAELREHGQYVPAHRLATRAISWYNEQSDAIAYRAGRADACRLSEQWAAARDLFEELAEDDPGNITYLGKLGTLAVRLGDDDRATRIFDALEHPDTPPRCGHHIFWRACISALRNEPELAVSLLQDAIDQGLDHYIDRMTSEIDLEPLRDYAPFQELIKPR